MHNEFIIGLLCGGALFYLSGMLAFRVFEKVGARREAHAQPLPFAQRDDQAQAALDTRISADVFDDVPGLGR